MPFESKDGDGGDYVAIRVAGGKLYALTTTCAANVLGYARPGMHAYGNPESARRAFAALARLTGQTVEDAARAVLEAAAAKVIPVVTGLIEEYQLDADQCLLIGEGGGAASVLPFVAETMRLKHEISKDAEVISSIGVALALIRDVIERIIPQPEDLTAIRQEALDAAVRMGADPATVDVTVEVDTTTHRVRAIASGAAEMRVKDPGGSISESEARSIAARNLGLPPGILRLSGATSGVRVYQAPGEGPTSVRAVTWDGAIRAQRSRALVHASTSKDLDRDLAEMWRAIAVEAHGRHAVSALWLVVGRHIIDLAGVETLDQARALAHSETTATERGEPLVLIGALGQQSVPETSDRDEHEA